MKSSIRSDRNASTFWNAQKYSQARIAIADEGDGLGKDFISHFMPTPPKDETLQSVIDSYYADRRKAAADRREAEAKERARMAKFQTFLTIFSKTVEFALSTVANSVRFSAGGLTRIIVQFAL